MKPMQGNSMGKLCFSTFVLENKIYLSFFFFLQAFFCCFSIHAHGMCLCRDDRAYSWFTSSNTSCLKKKLSNRRAGLQSGALGEKKQSEREHIETRLSHETRFFLSLFSAKVAESASKLVKDKQNNYGRLLWGLSIYKVSLGWRSFYDRSGCAHNRRTLEKKINVAIILLLRNACLISVTMLYVLKKKRKKKRQSYDVIE